MAKTLKEMTKMYNELHYAVRAGANILDPKLSEDEAHRAALAQAHTLWAWTDELYNLLSEEQKKSWRTSQTTVTKYRLAHLG